MTNNLKCFWVIIKTKTLPHNPVFYTMTDTSADNVVLRIINAVCEADMFVGFDDGLIAIDEILSFDVREKRK